MDVKKWIPVVLAILLIAVMFVMPTVGGVATTGSDGATAGSGVQVAVITPTPEPPQSPDAECQSGCSPGG
jgi:hypothetical protein